MSYSLRAGQNCPDPARKLYDIYHCCVHSEKLLTMDRGNASRIRTEPSWSCSQAISKPVWHIPLLCVQWKTPDDGQRNCPKHVDFYSKNKFEKLVHLVGFIIRTWKTYWIKVLDFSVICDAALGTLLFQHNFVFLNECFIYIFIFTYFSLSLPLSQVLEVHSCWWQVWASRLISSGWTQKVALLCMERWVS